MTAKKKQRKTVPWLSSSRSNWHVLQSRCQPTLIPNTYNVLERRCQPRPTIIYLHIKGFGEVIGCFDGGRGVVPFCCGWLTGGLALEAFFFVWLMSVVVLFFVVFEICYFCLILIKFRFKYARCDLDQFMG